MTYSRIRATAYHLPEQVLTNDGLEQIFPELPAAKVFAKTGIFQRHIAAEGETATDLAEKAALKLFASGACKCDEIDAIILCTQSPDYVLPTSACLLQARLGLRTNIAAFDFNLGCSGFVYGLGMAKGMIESGQVRNVLLLTSDTYSKHIHPKDRSVRTIFGDAAAATLISADESLPEASIGPFLYGTNGHGAEHLIIREGGARTPVRETAADVPGPSNLCMNGPEIFNFTLNVVPETVKSLCALAGTMIDAVDLFVFHQANAYMLSHLRESIGIPSEKFVISMKDVGNTVSASIPIALRDASDSGQLKPGMKVMLVGFGVGLSWAGAIVRW